MKTIQMSKTKFYFSFVVIIFLAILISYSFFIVISNVYRMVNAEENFNKYDTKSVETIKEIIEKDIIKKKEIIKENGGMNLKSIGTFELTAYCPCEICCEIFSGPALNKTGAIGVGIYEEISVAVDPNKIPYGTVLYIEDIGVRIASDCGGAIKGNRIDVYFEDHDEAYYSGLGHTPKQVYIVKEIK